MKFSIQVMTLSIGAFLFHVLPAESQTVTERECFMILAGKKATGYAAVRDDLVNAGAEFLDVPAIKDGNILTGRVPDDLPEFCQEIIKALSE